MICLLNMDVSYFKVGSIYLKFLGHIVSKYYTRVTQA